MSTVCDRDHGRNYYPRHLEHLCPGNYIFALKGIPTCPTCLRLTKKPNGPTCRKHADCAVGWCKGDYLAESHKIYCECNIKK